jgi:predicted transcriptional regulator
MGVGGVPFRPKKESIISALKKHGGIVTRAAIELGVARWVLSKYLSKHKEFDELKEDLRQNFRAQLCDKAETALEEILTQNEDTTNRLRSAQYILNNLGKERGYSPLAVQASGETARELINLLKTPNGQSDRASQPQAERELNSGDPQD